jgi:hypothetical protein
MRLAAFGAFPLEVRQCQSVGAAEPAVRSRVSLVQALVFCIALRDIAELALAHGHQGIDGRGL